MKNLLTTLIAICFTVVLSSQVPEKMSYQAVIRDASGQLVTTPIGMQISILQGTVDGTVVYSETQTPTPNINGLVTVEIGNGDPTSFSEIDWFSGPYFIKTETDPAGDVNYTIIGTSQLLSVPFALHAKTAEMTTGDSIWKKLNTDIYFNGGNLGIGTSKPSGDIHISDTLTTTSSSILNLETKNVKFRALAYEKNPSVWFQAGSSWTLGSSMDINFSGMFGSPHYMVLKSSGSVGIGTTTPSSELTVAGTIESTSGGIKFPDGTIQTTAITTYSIGDFTQGGIVFWVDETGQHGLVCAKTDQSTGVRWWAGTAGDTRAYGNHIYAGEMNTDIIIGSQIGIIGDDGLTYAAEICKDLTLDGYSDWYLPSKEELNLMYQNKVTIDVTAATYGGTAFGTTNYWSSTEHDSNAAWIQYFNSGSQQLGYKGADTFRMRAVRAF